MSNILTKSSSMFTLTEIAITTRSEFKAQTRILMLDLFTKIYWFDVEWILIGLDF